MNFVTRLPLLGAFLSLLMICCASNTMEQKQKITLSSPYDHDRLRFTVKKGIIELAEEAKVCFGSPALIERINYAGIKTYPNDLLVPVRILISDGKANVNGETPQIDWTQETPLCIKEPIILTSAAEIQKIDDMPQKSGGLSGIEKRRKIAIQKDAFEKIKDLVFPPAIPVRHLESTHFLTARAFDECVDYQLSFDNHAELNHLCNSKTFDILSIHDQSIQEKITSLKWLQRRPVQENNDDTESLEQYIDSLKADIQAASIENVYETAEYLENNDIIMGNDSQVDGERNHGFTFNPHFIAYSDSAIIPGPHAQINPRERAFNHHNLKRPFDLIINRQIASSFAKATADKFPIKKRRLI